MEAWIGQTKGGDDLPKAMQMRSCRAGTEATGELCSGPVGALLNPQCGQSPGAGSVLY